jgi:hypothetical protein
VQAYREYYLAEKVKQSRWTYREVPHFIEEVIMAKAEKKVAAPAVNTETPAEKKEAPAKSIGPKGVELTATITLLVSGNPKRSGSKAHGRFESYKEGMTVKQALDAGVTTPDLIYDASHSFIKIEGYAPKLVPVKPPKEPKAPKEPKEPKTAKTKAAPAAGNTEELE